MGSHLIDGKFQSDKYPETPRGLVPLKPTDPMAQDLLWQYAQRRRSVDAEFAEDLLEALRLSGYDPHKSIYEIGRRAGLEEAADHAMMRTQPPLRNNLHVGNLPDELRALAKVSRG